VHKSLCQVGEGGGSLKGNLMYKRLGGVVDGASGKKG